MTEPSGTEGLIAVENRPVPSSSATLFAQVHVAVAVKVHDHVADHDHVNAQVVIHNLCDCV